MRVLTREETGVVGRRLRVCIRWVKKLKDTASTGKTLRAGQQDEPMNEERDQSLQASNQHDAQDTRES